MSYLKVLLMIVFIFLCMIFFFQNQAPLSQEMQVSLNLFFIPPMTSISLPFYFIVCCAFLIGAVMTTLFFWWGRITLSTQLMARRWRIRSLESEVARISKTVENQMNYIKERDAKLQEANKAVAEAKAEAKAATDAKIAAEKQIELAKK